MSNRSLFDEVRDLKLRAGSYAITGSGPLGIRNIREMNDVDILVADEYWKDLLSRGELIEESGLSKLKISDNIEILYSGSFGKSDPSLPSVEDQIPGAELIDGLYFVSLEHLILFKSLSGREKDKDDVRLLEKWVKENT